MFHLLLGNMWLWFNILLVIIASLVIFYKTSEYNLHEVGAQIGISIVVIFLSAYLMFSFHTQIQQKEIWTSYAETVKYKEPWTEEYDCSTTDSKGRRTQRTCTTRHNPEYYVVALHGIIPIKKSSYLSWKREFGATEKSEYRHGQTTSSKLLGEGDIWTTTVSKPIPVSSYNNYDNYVTASTFTIQRTQKIKPNSVVPTYPSIYSGPRGNLYFSRVINGADVKNIPNTNTLDQQLALLAADVGSRKQINPLIYITTKKPISIVHDLEIAWKKGNKNDSVLVLQVDANGTVIGSDSLNWSSNKAFTTELRYAFDKVHITNTATILKNYQETIEKHWERRTMESFKYLLEDISLPLSDQFIIIFLNSILNIGLFFLFSRNQFRRIQTHRA